ncbi:MAG: Flp pilus assembly complex ATPase component TadA [Candidatus Hydrogenedentes bacterium]|nr:Flp pilus assembly complex ATPase component TadA [Candidatus Hydrogenedentota bacterium]
MSTKRLPEQDLVRTLPLKQIQPKLVEALESSDDTGVADAVDLAISQAAYHSASDVHLEPWADYLSLRYRLDGILQQVAVVPRQYQLKIVARIKVLADLVVYRKDVPQDGRIDQEKCTCGRPMRVSSIPTVKGEKIVIRLLGDTSDLYNLESLGFQPYVVSELREIVVRSQGTLLLTGPSSSGKTTTIYALLQEMMRLQKNTTNIVTIEDPVEYNMDRIAQIQVNPHVEFTFASALRSILRQDPEVIMVGEIRDLETAHMAIQSGLTGHFVISTIHAGTAAGVFTRLLDMGIEPYLVASSVSGVLAQRLVRLNCPTCAAAYKPDPVHLQHFNLNDVNARFFRGKGCEACQTIGYRGRASIGELVQVDQAIAESVLSRPTTSQLHQIAVQQGMKTLADDGLNKAQKGITTIEELVRVLPSTPA